MDSSRADLPSFEDAVASVTALLGTTIRPTIYQLRDGELVGALTVDPDVAFAALQLRDDWEADGRGDPSVQEDS